jgi:hypothetical protein
MLNTYPHYSIFSLFYTEARLALLFSAEVGLPYELTLPLPNCTGCSGVAAQLFLVSVLRL